MAAKIQQPSFVSARANGFPDSLMISVPPGGGPPHGCVCPCNPKATSRNNQRISMSPLWTWWTKRNTEGLYPIGSDEHHSSAEARRIIFTAHVQHGGRAD